MHNRTSSRGLSIDCHHCQSPIEPYHDNEDRSSPHDAVPVNPGSFPNFHCHHSSAKETGMHDATLFKAIRKQPYPEAFV